MVSRKFSLLSFFLWLVASFQAFKIFNVRACVIFCDVTVYTCESFVFTYDKYGMAFQSQIRCTLKKTKQDTTIDRFKIIIAPITIDKIQWANQNSKKIQLIDHMRYMRIKTCHDGHVGVSKITHYFYYMANACSR